MLTQERLKQLLHYDPDTGYFTWKVNRGKVKQGSIAGNTGATGYVYIIIDYKSYTAGRLACLYMEGEFPKKKVKYVNTITNDNKWNNLILFKVKVPEELTQERLKQLLYYDPDTGDFTWKVNRNTKVQKGDRAGTINTYGYVAIVVCGQRCVAHRLAFLYMEGELPPDKVDHRDRIRNNNKWSNLRHATQSENAQNKINNNKVIGVYFHTATNKWCAVTPAKNRKQKCLGRFINYEDAVACRKAWEAENNWKPFD